MTRTRWLGMGDSDPGDSDWVTRTGCHGSGPRARAEGRAVCARLARARSHSPPPPLPARFSLSLAHRDAWTRPDEPAVRARARQRPGDRPSDSDRACVPHMRPCTSDRVCASRVTLSAAHAWERGACIPHAHHDQHTRICPAYPHPAYPLYQHARHSQAKSPRSPARPLAFQHAQSRRRHQETPIEDVVCVCVCARARVRLCACARVCVRACVRARASRDPDR